MKFFSIYLAFCLARLQVRVSNTCRENRTTKQEEREMKTNETTLIPVDSLGTDVRTLPDGSKETDHYECSVCRAYCHITDNYCSECGRKIVSFNKEDE